MEFIKTNFKYHLTSDGNARKLARGNKIGGKQAREKRKKVGENVGEYIPPPLTNIPCYGT